MDVVDDADGPLDPRIQIELENLNTATDNINRLEIELDEAHTAFGQLWSESTRRLKDISNKLGANCIDRARCYYEALEVSRQARIQCQYQAQLFQRASEIHAAAKETVALAEARFMSHQHEWNFDQAWQDMLNHATIKVMDAENQKAECGREHRRRATLFHDAEIKVQQLEEKYRKSIIKAQPYFEIRAQYDEMLATQKECVERLRKAVKDAKLSYSSSFRALEDISNRIHQQRRDYDMVANGPREPGVGAELISPEDSLNYETELNKLSISRLNSLASSGEPDAEERSKDFDDVRDLKQRVDQLGGRSIDGSESCSSQWELELQASMEKLNNLSMKNSEWTSSEINGKNERRKVSENEQGDDNQSGGGEKIPKTLRNNENERKRVPIDFQILRKLSSNSTIANSSTDIRRSIAQSPINSIINRSKVAIRNGLSKSLSNSPVNVNFGFCKRKIDDNQRINDNEKATLNDDVTMKNSEDRISAASTLGANEDSISSVNFEISPISEPEASSSIVVVANDENLPFSTNVEPEISLNIEESTIREFNESRESEDSKNQRVTGEKVEKSRSVDSTPVRSKIALSRDTCGKSLKRENENFAKPSSLPRESSSGASSVRELPLLSFFENNAKATVCKDKSCSMINLAEKHNLKTLLDNPNLRNIQTVSVERLANARNNIIGQYSEIRKISEK